MEPLTSIFIVLAAAVLWVIVTSGSLALLGRAERRSGAREPRKSADGPKRRHGSIRPGKRKIGHGRAPRRRPAALRR